MFIILALALLLRLVRLNDSFWLDEAAQVLESARPFREQLQIAADFQPPLMHLLTFVQLRLGYFLGLGQSEWFIRLLPSVIPGVISVWALYQITLKLFPKHPKKVALAQLAALLLATNPFAIFFSQELRPYSLPAMWAGLSTLLLLDWSKKSQRWLFVLCSIAGLYSSYLYPFFLAAQLLYLLLVSKISIKSLIAPVLAIVLGFLPWLPKFLEQLRVGQALRLQMPGWEEVVSFPQFKSLPLVPAKFVFGLLDLELNVFFIALSLIIVGLVYLLAKNQRSRANSRTSWQFLAYFFCLPLLLAWLVSFFVPVLQPKRVLFLLPALMLFFSQLILDISSKKKALAGLLFVLIFGLNLFALTSYWYQPKLQRENWRSLVKQIESSFGHKKAVALFGFDAPFAPWNYYASGSVDSLASGSFYLNSNQDLAEQFKNLADYDYILLFDYLRDLTDPNDQLIKIIKDLGFVEAGLIDYPNIGFVRIYSQESNLAYANWH